MEAPDATALTLADIERWDPTAIRTVFRPRSTARTAHAPHRRRGVTPWGCITAFGHSYGSLVTSLALQQGAPVSDVVLYGSPGTELTHASQLGVEPGHAFYMIGVNDHVANTIPEFGAFGSAPQDVPGMTQLSVNTGLAPGPLLGDGQLHERA
ncbi:hypothetical protein HKBT1_1014 [Mycobacterium tuberculosis BT1]|uniref:alpha/beta hydrolase n=1 Tax=Mycobacterium tuberculosis TaxID=1773 RepID=UPI0003F1F47F|nr:alpha/beta hydrolase [Mycobacterium tuberculosis]AHJ49960.1 hypothetical protein HKBT1_1014 [Mycobacterium tuberculosis BT1]